VSRSAAVRQILLEILRSGKNSEDEEEKRVKLLLDNAVLEGTLDPARNERLLMHPINGFSEPINDNEVIVLLDVAIRPMSDPEVHLGINELKLFMDAIIGIIG
jgi:hypothetical protein